MMISYFPSTFRNVLAGSLLLIPPTTHADVTLPTIFGDHMVLQQGTTLPVWGWAKPGEKITVTFGDGRVATTADTAGKWRADLPAVAGAPRQAFSWWRVPTR